MPNCIAANVYSICYGLAGMVAGDQMGEGVKSDTDGCALFLKETCHVKKKNCKVIFRGLQGKMNKDAKYVSMQDASSSVHGEKRIYIHAIYTCVTPPRCLGSHACDE